LFLVKPKILSWDVSGLNERDKRLRIRSLLRDWKANIVCLQETKLEFISSVVMHNLWGCQHVDWCYVGSRGALLGVFFY
jgi:exonuclease III